MLAAGTRHAFVVDRGAPLGSVSFEQISALLSDAEVGA
jgi:hypothetical protein